MASRYALSASTSACAKPAASVTPQERLVLSRLTICPETSPQLNPIWEPAAFVKPTVPVTVDVGWLVNALTLKMTKLADVPRSSGAGPRPRPATPVPAPAAVGGGSVSGRKDVPP